MMSLSYFLHQAWQRYLKLTPDAHKILMLLEERGEVVVNDHIALRTFNISGIDRKSLGRIFEEWGYHAMEDLVFPEKKLIATYYMHSDESLPKVFISELILEELSNDLQKWLREIGSQCVSRHKLSPEVFLTPSWNPIDFKDYERAYPISEYAAWTAAFGIQINHFTISLNSLKTFKTLLEFNDFLLDHGIILNDSGGAIKGSAEQLLEQSSTLARKIPWTFAGGLQREVMGCYYEFAKRYVDPLSKKLFHGFIPASADKIFESTFEKKYLSKAKI